MLEPGDILVDCTGARSLMRDLPDPGRRPDPAGPQHQAIPARVRPGHHVPLRPALRVQRVLQVLQEPRQRRLQVHPGGPSHLLRRTISHVTGIVSISQAEYEAMPPNFDGAWLRDNFPASPSRWTASSTRSGPRRTASSSVTSTITRIPLDLYRATERHQPTLARIGHRSPAGRGAGLPARGLGDRLALLPVDLARPRVRVLPGRPHRQSRACRCTRCSSATRGSCTGNGCASTCARQMIKHNKDLLKSVDDTRGLLAKLHVFRRQAPRSENRGARSGGAPG